MPRENQWIASLDQITSGHCPDHDIDIFPRGVDVPIWKSYES